MQGLSARNLVDLVRSVFPRLPEDRALGILVDIPRDPGRDNPAWQRRRAMAEEWWNLLRENAASIPLESVRLIAYPDVGSNNAELPADGFIVRDGLPPDASGLSVRLEIRSFETIFRETQIFLAPTECSTTAPLKNAAKRHLFRAATMPGFSEMMIPALRIDYAEVGRRVALLKARLDPAAEARIDFLVDGTEPCAMTFDLRSRSAHESSGRFPERGTAGNLPSGEAYIVPFEGDETRASRTEGVLPVEVDGEVVRFTVKGNRAYEVLGSGPARDAEAAHLTKEPAYGNMAELGFGVLGDFGLPPVGEILLDEKLGLHVAFGRSDHFGGRVGPADFSSAAEVIHLDRIYIPATQPRIFVRSVILRFPDSPPEILMENGRYRIF